jgi:hypothetical protein
MDPLPLEGRLALGASCTGSKKTLYVIALLYCTDAQIVIFLEVGKAIHDGFLFHFSRRV